MSLLYLGDSYALVDPLHSNWAVEWGRLGNFEVQANGAAGRNFVDMAVTISKLDLSQYSGVILHYTNILRLRGSSLLRNQDQLAQDLLSAQSSTVPNYIKDYAIQGMGIQPWHMQINHPRQQQAQHIYTNIDTQWLTAANWFAVQYICQRTLLANVPLIVTHAAYADTIQMLDINDLPGCTSIVTIPGIKLEWQSLAENSSNHICLEHARWFAQYMQDLNNLEKIFPL
jgi:hypothetical protein